MSLWPLAVNSVAGLIIFWMLCAYVDSSGTHISARWVHSSQWDFSIVKCTLILHSGISGRIILLFKRRCFAADLAPQIVIVARFCTCRLP